MENVPMKILVVDDEPFIQDLLQSLLTVSGYKTEVASNGLEALGLLAKYDYDLVLMDVRMPEMDGLATIKFLRKCEQGGDVILNNHSELAQELYLRRNGSRIPVVGVTANIDDRIIMLQAGMDDFISKPFEFDRLFEVINGFDKKNKEEIFFERRKYHRYLIKDDSVTIVNGKPGQVTDISFEGLAIKFTNIDHIPKEWNVNLLNKDKKLLIENLHLITTRIVGISYSESYETKTQTVGAVFFDMDSKQQQQIKQFVQELV